MFCLNGFFQDRKLTKVDINQKIWYNDFSIKNYVGGDIVKKSAESEINEYIGRKIGNLTVIGLSNENKHFNSKRWIFRCDCGNEIVDFPSRILSGHKKTCGCGRYLGCITHNCNNHPLYHTWWSMVQRCHNEKHHNYSRYGKRGISVCSEWRSSPEKFIEWVESIGGKPVGTTLDRIKNNLGYSPDNCRFVSMKIQSNNRSTNKMYTINEETKTFTQWCEYYKIEDHVVWERIKKLKWDIEKAFITPVGIHGSTGKQIEIDGQYKSISQWCKIHGISRSTAYKRIAKGVDYKTAVSKNGTKGKPLF